MKIKSLTFFIIFNILFFYSNSISISQDIFGFRTETYAFHPKIGYLYNIHIADFEPLIEGYKCGSFNSGFGFGNSLFLFVEKPISELTHLSVGLGYSDRSADLINQYAYSWYNNEIMEVVDVTADYVYSTKITYIEIHTEIRTVLLQRLINAPLRVMGAIRLLIPSKSFEYNYYKEIVSPKDAVFIDNDNSRVQKIVLQNGNLARQIGMGYGLSLGLENMLKLSNNVLFTQQLVFDYNLTHFTEDKFWYGMGVRFEVGFRLGFSKSTSYIKPSVEEQRIYEDPTLKQPPIVERKIPTAKIIAVEYDDLNVKYGEELLATLPVVNSIFFDTDSINIPDRYIVDYNNNIKIPRFSGDAIKKHYFILPEIKSILDDNPNALIRVIGYKSLNENTALPFKRADNTSIALINMGIDKDRIIIDAQDRPLIPSNENFAKGILENQRVDLILENAYYQEYVSFRKFRELNGKIKVNINFENIDKRNQIILTANFTDKKIICKEPGVYTFDLNKRINDSQMTFDYKIFLQYGDDKLEESRTINIDTLPHRLVDLELSNFEAILRFDYNSDILIPENKELLRQLINILPQGTKINIFGTADKLGTTQRNSILSESRSMNTENYIRSINKKMFILEQHSDRIGKFDETTQQGRFLNRSITVTLEK